MPDSLLPQPIHDPVMRKRRLSQIAAKLGTKPSKNFRPGTDVFGPWAADLQARVALAYAIREVGVKEEGGNNRGRRVQQYQQVTDLGGTGWPWCAAFVCWCYRMATWPESFAGWGEAAVVEWVRSARNRQHGLRVTDNPGAGDLACFDFQGDGIHDHIGIVRWKAGPIVRTIEGNTSGDDAGSQDDGGGVYKKLRLHRSSNVYIKVVS